jgi:nucleotide-binding universal stress UspA family protein
MSAIPFSSILVATDGSSTAQTAVEHAISLARAVDAKLAIVAAYEPSSREGASGAGEGAAEAGAGLGPHDAALLVLSRAVKDANAAGVEVVETFARQGDPADAIIDVAEEQSSDLIVVGNKGMTGARRFLLGSVPNKVSHHAPCSVLIVRTS